MSQQISPDQFLILAQQNKELQKIIDSQAQQISFMKTQIHENERAQEKLKNQNDQLRQKCMENRANHEKMFILKEALEKDFFLLNQVVVNKQKIIQCLRNEIELLSNELRNKNKVYELCDLTKFEMQRKNLKIQEKLKDLQQEKQELNQEIRRLKLANIDDRIALASEKPPKNSKQLHHQVKVNSKVKLSSKRN